MDGRVSPLFSAAGLLAWFLFHDNLLSAWWLLVPVLLFVVLLARHDRLLRLWSGRGVESECTNRDCAAWRIAGSAPAFGANDL